MNAFFEGQEFKDMLWATPMPVMAMIGGEMARVRVMGVCAARVTDAASMNEHVSDPNALLPKVRSILGDAVTDAVTAKSRSVSSVEELAGMNEQVTAELKSNAAPEFEKIGLEITELEIQSLEGV